MAPVACQGRLILGDGSASRRLELDAAKGLAMVLVVAGHVVARDISPLGNDWYPWANFRLYSFHMAFFFFLAGWVYFLRPIADWQSRWVRTARRLVPAYVLFAATVFLAKFTLARFLPVDRPVGQLLTELTLQLLYPTQGFASFLWFIVVLLQIQWAAPLLMTVFRGHRAWVLTLAVVLHLASVSGFVSEVIALKEFSRYLLFFLLGAWVVEEPGTFKLLADRWLLFLTLLAAIVIWVPPPFLRTVAALVSLPALYGLACFLHERGWSRWLIFVGINSFTIYLMNSLCMGLMRALVLRTTGWDGAIFPFVAALLLLSGLLLPVLVQRLLFARVAALDRITR